MERSGKKGDRPISNAVLLARMESQWKADLESRKKWQKYVYENWAGYLFYDSDRWDGLLDLLASFVVDQKNTDKIDERTHLFQFFMTAGLGVTALGVGLGAWTLDVLGMALVGLSILVQSSASKMQKEMRVQSETALKRLPALITELKKQQREYESLKSQFEQLTSDSGPH